MMPWAFNDSNLYYEISRRRGRPRLSIDAGGWTRAYANPARVLRKHIFGGTRVSTIFLGRDHGFRIANPSDGSYRPVLWETAIFREGEEPVIFRSSSWQQAVAWHRQVCVAVRRLAKQARQRKGLTRMRTQYAARRR